VRSHPDCRKRGLAAHILTFQGLVEGTGATSAPLLFAPLPRIPLRPSIKQPLLFLCLPTNSCTSKKKEASRNRCSVAVHRIIGIAIRLDRDGEFSVAFVHETSCLGSLEVAENSFRRQEICVCWI